LDITYTKIEVKGMLDGNLINHARNNEYSLAI